MAITTFTELSAYLRAQAPLRGAKRDARLDGVARAALDKVAALIDTVCADAAGEALARAFVPGIEGGGAMVPALPISATPAPGSPFARASAMQPIVGTDALAELESAARAADVIDRNELGLVAPGPARLEPEPDDPFGALAELADEELGIRAPAAPTGDNDEDNPEPTEAPSVAVPLRPGEPAHTGHYAPGLTQPEYAGKAEPGSDAEATTAPAEEPRYRVERSVSQLTKYGECGLKYKLSYLEHAPEVPAWWSVGGDAFHLIAREWEQARVLDGYTATADNVAERFEHALDIEVERALAAAGLTSTESFRAAGRGGREGREWWYDNGPSMIANYVKAHESSSARPLVVAGSPVLEAKLSSEIAGVRVSGYIDQLRIDHDAKTLTVVDYKTGSRMPTDPAQRVTYAALAVATFGSDVPADYALKAEHWNARKAEVSGQLTISSEMITANADRFEAFDQAERAGIYLANPSTFCGSCGVRASCPVMSPIPRAKSEASAIEFTE